MFKPSAFIRKSEKSRGSSYNILLGSKGERIAKRYLRRHGYRIEEVNYTTKFAEVDIIGWDGDVLAFVEVKTRTSDLLGEPEESVNIHKQRKIILAAKYYINKNRLWDTNARFDIVSIKYRGRFSKQIALFKDAFRLQ